MARFNEILAGRFSRYADKLFSIKGHASLPVLVPELQLVLPFPGGGVEDRYLSGWDLFGRQVACTPGAGNVSASSLRNPAGSGVVGVAYRLAYSTGGAVDGFTLYVYRGGALTDENTIDTAVGWDSRGRPASTLIVSHNNAAAPSGNAGGTPIYGTFNLPAATNADAIPATLEIPILPGEKLYVAGNTANNSDNFYWWWRERPLEDSEKQ